MTNILKYTTLVFLVTFTIGLKAQGFAEASVGLSLLEDNVLIGTAKRATELHLQIGKFVNNRKMRSFTLTYRSALYKDEEVLVSPNNSTSTKVKSNERVTATSFVVGYERKVCFANTEFDDPWQFYNLLNYHFTFRKVSQEFSNSQVTVNNNNDIDNLEESIPYGLGLGFGLGAARKINNNIYSYIEIRGNAPFLLDPTAVKLNFGVRYMF